MEQCVHSHSTRTAMAICFIVCLVVASLMSTRVSGQQTLDPNNIPKYVTPLVVPPAMPKSPKKFIPPGMPKNFDYYQIAVRQFQQQILPAVDAQGQPTGLGPTTVWGYGSVDFPATFNYPAFTIEAKVGKPIRVKWINDLVDAQGNYLPHLLPVDPTLHWANPPGGTAGRDERPEFSSLPGVYTGPVPMVTHVHGAHTYQESDGYPEAWYLPAAKNIPMTYALTGTYYDEFKQTSPTGAQWGPGFAIFDYPNDQRAATLWYHDHALGMTRLNVYAGPAGFYNLRGGPTDMADGALPGPAPTQDDPPGMSYYEIPIAIQDRSFQTDGSLWYPDNRAFFEGLNPFDPMDPEPPYLDIPFIGETACDGQQSDISPYWNPEFFGNTIVANGNTWPSLNVEPRRYRFRLLNGCQSRFLITKLVSDPEFRPANPGTDPFPSALPFWQIGSEGGFLPAPVQLDQLLIGPAERADVIVDFTGLAPNTKVYMVNLGPDEPFGGGIPGVDFDWADPMTTGQVMQFNVVPMPAGAVDMSVPPSMLVLPAFTPVGNPNNARDVSLNEEDSRTVKVEEDEEGNIILDCENGEFFGPVAAELGTVMFDMGIPMGMPMEWMHASTETPVAGTVEQWNIYNFTMDAHPIHIHLVQFQVVDRQPFDMDTGALGTARPPEIWENGYKDTVIAYPGEVTRVKALFDIPGLFVWHCHILEHEDNEMMRPYEVLAAP